MTADAASSIVSRGRQTHAARLMVPVSKSAFTTRYKLPVLSTVFDPRDLGGDGNGARLTATAGHLLGRDVPEDRHERIRYVDVPPRRDHDGVEHASAELLEVRDELQRLEVVDAWRPGKRAGDKQQVAIDTEACRLPELTTAVQRRFPEDTSVRFGYLPVLRAQLSLNDGNPSEALQALEPAARFDLAAHGVSYNAFFGRMYTVYVRGEAYLAANQPAEALGEFERIIAHRGIVLADPVDALARLQRARMLAAAGKTTHARRAYEDLMTTWATADAGVPLLERARAEYAALR